MAYIPYSDFSDAVKLGAFPEAAGEATNLSTAYDNYIQDALINLQTFVPCLRDNHVDFYDKSDFQEWCGTDFNYIERGVVHAVYAFKPGKECRKFMFDQKSTSFIGEWMDAQRCVKCSDQTEATDITRSPLCNEMVNADVACDDYYDNADESDCVFKSSRRYYGIGPNNKLYLAPRIPCGYKVAVHWEGIKRTWSGTDPVPDDAELKIAVVKYVLAQAALFLDKDTQLYDRIMHPKLGEFNLARADMIHRCSRERRIQARHQALDGIDVLQPFFFDPLPEAEDLFAYIADWGLPGVDLTAVDDLVESWDPQFIVTGGDNKYGVSMATALAAAPYVSSKVDDELVYPSIANHDLGDGGGLADFLAEFPYITYTANRNYSIRKNHVEFFFFETHDTGTAPPDLTLQEAWLAGALAASTARFKVVVTQDPPYTSEDDSNYPGHADSQLDYEGMGADVVLSGDSHFYERFNVDGFPTIIGGWSGGVKSDFNAIPVDGSLVRYNDMFGAIRGTASHNHLKLEAINTAGETIDVLELTKP